MSSTLEQFEELKVKVNSLEDLLSKAAGRIVGLERTQQNLSMMLMSVVDSISRSGTIPMEEFELGLLRAQQKVAVSQVRDFVAKGDLQPSEEVEAQSVVLITHERLNNDGSLEEVMDLACLGQPSQYLGKKVGDKAPVDGTVNEFFTIKEIYKGTDREIQGEEASNVG